jgi:hypothetical protein
MPKQMLLLVQLRRLLHMLQEHGEKMLVSLQRNLAAKTTNADPARQAGVNDARPGIAAVQQLLLWKMSQDMPLHRLATG